MNNLKNTLKHSIDLRSIFGGETEIIILNYEDEVYCLGNIVNAALLVDSGRMALITGGLATALGTFAYPYKMGKKIFHPDHLIGHPGIAEAYCRLHDVPLIDIATYYIGDGISVTLMFNYNEGWKATVSKRGDEGDEIVCIRMLGSDHRSRAVAAAWASLAVHFTDINW